MHLYNGWLITHHKAQDASNTFVIADIIAFRPVLPSDSCSSFGSEVTFSLLHRQCSWCACPNRTCDVAEYRLQLKRGLFWYRHHPKIHEMVSDRSWRAANWTDLRKLSMRVFLGLGKYKRNTRLGQQNANMWLFVKQIFEKLQVPHQNGKKTI